jgi:hypothetical protein
MTFQEETISSTTLSARYYVIYDIKLVWFFLRFSRCVNIFFPIIAAILSFYNVRFSDIGYTNWLTDNVYSVWESNSVKYYP